MQDISKDYQKILDFICHLDDVDDLNHLFHYLDQFWQGQFGTSPTLVYSSTGHKKSKLRDHWNKGKESIYYTKEEIKLMTAMIGDVEETKRAFQEFNDSTFIYTLECGRSKNQIYYLCFKVDREISLSVLDYLVPFLSTLLIKIDRYNKADDLKSLIHIDDVTGLYNQRKFTADIDRSIGEYEKSNSPFSLVFIDIDHFKKVNDGHGHLVGSSLLTSVSKLIKDSVRDNDLCYRYGGDEFVVLLPITKTSEAEVVGNRILSTIKNYTFSVEEGAGIGEASEFKLTVSIGIASYPEDAKSRVDIINMADKMMYKAKQTGRGKVCHTGELFNDDDEK